MDSMQRRCPQYDYVTLDTCSDLSYYLCKLHQFRQILECRVTLLQLCHKLYSRTVRMEINA